MRIVYLSDSDIYLLLKYPDYLFFDAKIGKKKALKAPYHGFAIDLEKSVSYSHAVRQKQWFSCLCTVRLFSTGSRRAGSHSLL